MRTEPGDVGVAHEGEAAPTTPAVPGGDEGASTSAVRDSGSLKGRSVGSGSGVGAGGPPPPQAGGRRRRRPVLVGLAVLVLGLAAYVALDDGAPTPPTDRGREQAAEDGEGEGDGGPTASDGEDGGREVVGDPFEGRSLYVEADNPARRQADEWRSSRPSDAATMERLGGSPTAQWFGRANGQVRRDVDRYVSAAADEGTLPVLVAYNIPQRDCGHFSSGGADSVDAYRSWIGDFAGGIGNRPAVVILEPDALAQLSCLSEPDRMTRIRLLDEAVGLLEARPGVSVYIDAGNPGWIPADDMAELLRAAGVDRARGFALNVSNYHSTEYSVAFAQELSGRLGGKAAVIDTSRNGAGSDGEWCNAMGRALGPLPSDDTASPVVDAYLWVKTPGESDGECNGGPSAGGWWPEYALDLAARASS